MKVLNELSLAVAISVAISVATVSVQAEMASIDDAVMSDITGQAGVTIEMSTALTVGQVTYKDEGSVLINTIAIGGGLTAGAVTGSMVQTQTIDVNANGDLVIGGSAGSVGLTVGSIQLQDSAVSATNTLIQDVYLAADLGVSAITVYNGDISLNAMDAAVGITAAALVVANTDLGDANVSLGDANVVLATATADQVTAQNNLDAEIAGANDAGTVATLTTLRDAADATLATATADQATAATDQAAATAGQAAASTAAADAVAVQPSAAALAAGASGSVIDISSAIKITDAGATINLGSGSIGISGVTFDNDGGFATMSQKIWAQDDASGTRSAGLVIESGAIQGDLTVGVIELGGVSIGSVAVSKIDMAGSTMVVFGH